MVTKIEYLNNLKELNLLNTGVKFGIIPISEDRNFKLYNYYNKVLTEQKDLGNSDYKARACFHTAFHFGISEPQVYLILRGFK